MRALPAVILTCLGALAQSPGDVCDVVRIPGGLAKGDTVYLTGPDATIDAVDVRNGRTRWHADVDATPVALTAQGLVAVNWSLARPNVIKVLTLDGETGAPRMTSWDVELPPSVSRARLPGGEVALLAHAASDRVFLDWSAAGPRSHGANPQGGVPDREREGGTVEIDAATGRVVSATTTQAAGTAALPSSSLPYWREGRMVSGSWTVGGTPFGLSMANPADRPITVSLKRGSSPPIELVRGSSPTSWVSADGTAIFVRPDTRMSTSVSVFDVVTGRRLGAVPYEPRATEFSLACGRVFYTVPQGVASTSSLLHAIQLDGRRLWSHPIAGRTALPRTLPR